MAIIKVWIKVVLIVSGLILFGAFGISQMHIQDKPIPKSMQIDYRYKTTMPIRDMQQDGEIIFLVDVYGWTGKNVCIIPGGSDPFVKAVERMGLDPLRYQAVLLDVKV